MHSRGCAGRQLLPVPSCQAFFDPTLRMAQGVAGGRSDWHHALWLGAAAYRNPGWLQGFGYLLQMPALPEIYLARSMRGDPLKWIVVASALLALTSFLWAGLLVWLAHRVRPADEKP
jgi:hypothetical protein